MAGKIRIGRPAHYETPEALAEKVNEYFNSTPRTHWRVTGLCLFLGFSSRASLTDYAKRSEDFSYILKTASLLVEDKYVENMEGVNPTGSMFMLKNMNYSNTPIQDEAAKKILRKLDDDSTTKEMASQYQKMISEMREGENE